MHQRSSQLETECIRIQNKTIPQSANGLKLAVLADMHGVVHPQLNQALKKINPNALLLIGDIIDGVQNPNEIMEFLKEQPYPMFYVCGNHEAYRHDFETIMDQISNLGITILHESCTDFHGIRLCGMSDPSLHARGWKERLAWLSTWRPDQSETFTILLFHRGDLYPYIKDKADLVVSGHLHGGQWRIGKQGICAPGFKRRLAFFPKHVSGLNQTLVMSRGLGDQMKFGRINNPWHLPVLILES